MADWDMANTDALKWAQKHNFDLTYAGIDLTPEQILEHLEKEVGERAAIPKEIQIVDEIPLTGVGKIFKPALRWDAIRRVYEKELEALGGLAESVEVAVREDKIFGSLAEVTVKAGGQVSHEAIRGKDGGILSRYTIHHELTIV